MPGYTTALFDLDGTLIDSSACIIACMQHAFAAHGFPEPMKDAVLARMGVPLERSIGMLEPRAEAIRDQVIATYRARYREIAPTTITVFPGIATLLQRTREAGLRVAVVTSKKTGPAQENCEQLGLARWIETIVGSDAASKYKPDPEPALVALRRLEVVPDRRVIVVGDASFDLQMGHAAGAATCAVTWGAQSRSELESWNPTHIAGSVNSLEAILLSSPI